MATRRASRHVAATASRDATGTTAKFAAARNATGTATKASAEQQRAAYANASPGQRERVKAGMEKTRAVDPAQKKPTFKYDPAGVGNEQEQQARFNAVNNVQKFRPVGAPVNPGAMAPQPVMRPAVQRPVQTLASNPSPRVAGGLGALQNMINSPQFQQMASQAGIKPGQQINDGMIGNFIRPTMPAQTQTAGIMSKPGINPFGGSAMRSAGNNAVNTYRTSRRSQGMGSMGQMAGGIGQNFAQGGLVQKVKVRTSNGKQVSMSSKHVAFGKKGRK